MRHPLVRSRGAQDTEQIAAVQNEKQQQEETTQLDTTVGMLVPFCEANLNFVHNESLYSLHPRMQIGETVYIENAP